MYVAFLFFFFVIQCTVPRIFSLRYQYVRFDIIYADDRGTLPHNPVPTSKLVLLSPG